MPDYSKTTIYMIKSRHTSSFYIGFTVTTLARTKALFRQEYKKYQSGFVRMRPYFELMQYDDVQFRFIELKNFSNFDEATEYVQQLRELHMPPVLPVQPLPIIERQRTVLLTLDMVN